MLYYSGSFTNYTKIPCLTFSSDRPFILSTVSGLHGDGTIYYDNSASLEMHLSNVWDGSLIYSSSTMIDGNYILKLAGVNGTYFSSDSQSYTNFGFTWVGQQSTIKCSGNLMTVLDYQNPPTSLTERYTCYRLFCNCHSLVTAPVLPATTLAFSCYREMFCNCTSLVTAPALPATTLANDCYEDMFSGCTSLVTAPALPATTLADSCYYTMFQNCTSLVTAPALPATTLANYCYYTMFYNCTSLVTAPALPATTLANDCYRGMFRKCSSLTTIPTLPATTLADYCYVNMFFNCSSLLIYTSSGTGHTNKLTMGKRPTAAQAAQMFYGTQGDYATMSTSVQVAQTVYTQNSPIS